ncbi:MAG: hypothetical protein Q7R95_08920 [bacterium]|nr:hypothetical protein [bacterium]
MSDKTRILLQKEKGIKKFFFITPNNDGSIFFGSSLPKPKEMKIGSIQIPSDVNKGKSKIDFKEVKNIEPSVSKFSYHPPLTHPNSIIQLKNDEKDNKYIFFKYKVSQLETMASYRKLFVIIPKNPITFPNFTKVKSQNDIIIPINCFKDSPFCVDIYLCKKNFNYKQLFSPGEISITGVCENKDYVLIIKLYHKSKFINWPTYTSFIPYIDGLDIEIDSIP